MKLEAKKKLIYLMQDEPKLIMPPEGKYSSDKQEQQHIIAQTHWYKNVLDEMGYRIPWVSEPCFLYYNLDKQLAAENITVVFDTFEELVNYIDLQMSEGLISGYVINAKSYISAHHFEPQVRYLFRHYKKELSMEERDDSHYYVRSSLLYFEGSKHNEESKIRPFIMTPKTLTEVDAMIYELRKKVKNFTMGD